MVSCLGIRLAMVMFKPNKLKIDCEGEEFAIVMNMKFEGIKEMIIEYHFNTLHDYDHSRYLVFINKLKENFSQVVYNANPGKNWTTVVHVKN
jgi:hypothetical protein